MMKVLVSLFKSYFGITGDIAFQSQMKESMTYSSLLQLMLIRSGTQRVQLQMEVAFSYCYLAGSKQMIWLLDIWESNI